MSRVNRATAAQSLSVSLTVGAYGIAFGAASVAAGFSVLQSCLLSLLTFTGASQFAVVGVLGAGGSALSGIATASLPDLPYDYGELAPVIIPEIMELHHKKHHQAYVTNLNNALEQAAEADKKGDLKALIALQPAIKFNGGGTYFF